MDPKAAIFANRLSDFSVQPQTIEGQIPVALTGSLLRNGPGQQRVGANLLHPLDGHSFVVAARFTAGQLNITGKHADTAAHRAERNQKQQTQRYVFTNRPGGALANAFRLKLANSAAHDVYAFAGKVYAADVFGHYALDPVTLDTVGVSPLDALIEKPVDQISPMPRLHSDGSTLSAYRMRAGVFGADRITLYDLGRDGKLSPGREHVLEGNNNAVHDLAITESHDVVVRWGRVAPGPVALGTASAGASIALPPGDTLVYLLPRSADEKRHVVRLPRQQIFHLFNAFRQGDALVLDVVAYDEAIDFTRVHPERYQAGPETRPRVRRHTISLTDGSVTTRNYDASGEAPDVDQRCHGRPSRYGYVAGVDSSAASPIVRSAYFWSNATLKVDFESGVVTRWQAPDGAFLSPPAFVPSGSGEDEGFVLTWMTLGSRSAVVILDARALASGPIATAWFDEVLPATSHTSWMPA